MDPGLLGDAKGLVENGNYDSLVVLLRQMVCCPAVPSHSAIRGKNGLLNFSKVEVLLRRHSRRVHKANKGVEKSVFLMISCKLQTGLGMKMAKRGS